MSLPCLRVERYDGWRSKECVSKHATYMYDNVMISMLYMYMYIGDSNRFPYSNSPSFTLRTYNIDDLLFFVHVGC